MKSFYVGVKGLIKDSEKGTLLLHRTDGDHAFWELPGGRIEADETFEQALTRELKEEILNIGTIAVGELLGAYRVNRELEKGHGLLLLYFDVTAAIPDEVQLSDEHDGYMLYDGSGEVPEPVNPTVREMLLHTYGQSV